MWMILLALALIVWAGFTTAIYVYRGKHSLIPAILILTGYLMGWFLLTNYKSFCF